MSSISSLILTSRETIAGGVVRVMPERLGVRSNGIHGSICINISLILFLLHPTLHFGLDRFGNAEMAGTGERLAVFLDEKAAHRFFAMAAAEQFVDADGIEHGLQHLRHKHALEILGCLARGLFCRAA